MNRTETVAALTTLQAQVQGALILARHIARSTESDYILPNVQDWALTLSELDEAVTEVLS